MIEIGQLSGVLTELEAHLQDVADAFLAPPQSVADREHVDLIRLIKSYAGDEFSSRFTAARVEGWLDYFGEDLALNVKVLDTGKEYPIAADSKPKLAELLQHLERYDVTKLTATLELRKGVLIRQIGAVINTVPHAVFLSAMSLRKRCTLSGVETLYQSGIISNGEHAVIAVLDADGLLQSPFITVIGMRGLLPEPDRSLVLPTARGKDWDRARSWRAQNTFWEGVLSGVPPDAFQVRALTPGLESVRSVMLGVSDVLSVLQFCSTVASAPKRVDGIVLRNGGPSIHVPTDTMFEVAEEVGPDATTAPFRTYRWVYRREDEDKLDIVRDLMERELRNVQENPLSHLLRGFDSLLDSARASYSTIRKKAFDAYIRVRGEALASVDAFAAATQANIDKVRDDMLNRVLQFFAAVIAYLTVSVLKPDISRQLMAVGIGLGVIYILMILIFQMLPSWRQYQEQRAKVKTKVTAYAELSRSERQKILSKVPTEFLNSFTGWYFACLGMYVLGMAVLLFGVWYLTR